MLGGRQAEMAVPSTIGDWFCGNGLAETTGQAHVASPWMTDSLLKCSNVKRTRYAQAFTVCAFYQLLKDSYNDSNSSVSFEKYRKSSQHTNEFRYWLRTLKFETEIFDSVKSIRVGDFNLYVWWKYHHGFSHSTTPTMIDGYLFTSTTCCVLKINFLVVISSSWKDTSLKK